MLVVWIWWMKEREEPRITLIMSGWDFHVLRQERPVEVEVGVGREENQEFRRIMFNKSIRHPIAVIM